MKKGIFRQPWRPPTMIKFQHLKEFQHSNQNQIKSKFTKHKPTINLSKSIKIMKHMEFIHSHQLKFQQ